MQTSRVNGQGQATGGWIFFIMGHIRSVIFFSSRPKRGRHKDGDRIYSDSFLIHHSCARCVDLLRYCRWGFPILSYSILNVHGSRRLGLLVSGLFVCIIGKPTIKHWLGDNSFTGTKLILVRTFSARKLCNHSERYVSGLFSEENQGKWENTKNVTYGNE